MSVVQWVALTYLTQVWSCTRAASFWPAYLNIETNMSASASAFLGNQTLMWREAALFGRESPLRELKGRVFLANPVHACRPNTSFGGARAKHGWIALLKRGNGCTFTEKINRAADRGAVAAVIYNEDETQNNIIQMAHPGTTIVAVMMGNVGGTDLAELLQKGVPVTMEIEVGRMYEPGMNHSSIFLIAISFIIITMASVTYVIYYTARRLYRTRVQNHKQRQLKATAKKVIGQLQIRTLKHEDKETGPDADACAVCIEVYKVGDIVSVLTCSHFFHKVCIEPWLLEHTTCPMCKCDVLKALGVELDDNSLPDLSSSNTEDSHTHIDSVSHTLSDAVSHTHSEAASSGYESINSSGDTHNGLNTVCVEMRPHYDNPVFERDTRS